MSSAVAQGVEQTLRGSRQTPRSAYEQSELPHRPGFGDPDRAAIAVALAGMRPGQAVRVRMSPRALRFWFFAGLLGLGAYLAARGLN